MSFRNVLCLAALVAAATRDSALSQCSGRWRDQRRDGDYTRNHAEAFGASHSMIEVHAGWHPSRSISSKA